MDVSHLERLKGPNLPGWLLVLRPVTGEFRLQEPTFGGWSESDRRLDSNLKFVKRPTQILDAKGRHTACCHDKDDADRPNSSADKFLRFPKSSLSRMPIAFGKRADGDRVSRGSRSRVGSMQFTSGNRDQHRGQRRYSAGVSTGQWSQTRPGQAHN